MLFSCLVQVLARISHVLLPKPQSGISKQSREGAIAQRGAGCAEYLSFCMNACVAKTAKGDQDQLKTRKEKVLG